MKIPQVAWPYRPIAFRRKERYGCGENERDPWPSPSRTTPWPHPPSLARLGPGLTLLRGSGSGPTVGNGCEGKGRIYPSLAVRAGPELSHGGGKGCVLGRGGAMWGCGGKGRVASQLARAHYLLPFPEDKSNSGRSSEAV